MTREVAAKRRWLRLSLRSGFVLLTLISCVLAWIAKERRQSAYERQVGEMGDHPHFMGPYDSYELLITKQPQGWWRDLARNVLGERIRSITMVGDEIDLVPLSRLTHLEHLWIETQGDLNLTPLSDCPALVSLEVNWANVHDLSPLAGLTKLKDLMISTMPLNTSDYDDREIRPSGLCNLKPLCGLKNLQSLALYGTSVTDLTPLTGLGKLTELEFGDAPVCGGDVLSPLYFGDPMRKHWVDLQWNSTR